MYGYENINNLKSFSLLELQYYFDLKIINQTLLSHYTLFNNIKSILKTLKINDTKNKKYFDRVNNFFKNQINVNQLNINKDELLYEFISIIFICSFNDYFIRYENNSTISKNINQFNYDNKMYFTTHDIINNFSDLLNNFYIFFNSGEGIWNSEKKINKFDKYNEEFCHFLISIFENYKIICKKQIKNNNKKINFFCLNNTENNFLININLKINFIETRSKYIENNMYLLGKYFTNVTKVFKKNIKSDNIFILNNYNALNKIKSIKYFLDQVMYKTILKEIKHEYNFQGNDENFLKYIVNEYRSTAELSYFSHQQKLNSQYYNIILFLYLLKYEIVFEYGFYLNCCFDFRGRIYTDSVISPVGNKIFRFLYNYGDYSEEELKNFKIIDKKYLYTKYILEKTNLKKIYENLNLNFFQEIIETVFIELGKINKSNFLVEYNGMFSKKNFIDFGIILFNDFNKNNLKLDFNKKIEILHLINILTNFNNNVFKKFIVYKDATASAIQLLVLLLETKNENNIKICNLYNDGFWRDTYYHIIKLFLEKNKNNLNKISVENFTRKNLKKTIMIFNYNAEFITCWLDFCDNCGLYKLNNNNININYNLILSDFKKFYSFLEELFNKDIFYKHSIDDYISEYKKILLKTKNLNFVTVDKSEANFIYLKEKIIRLDKIIFKKRTTLRLMVLSDEINTEKTFSSFLPNLIHCLDATYARLILSNLPYGIITIHDCFGIDILNTNNLVNSANFSINQLYFGLNGKKENFSLKFYNEFILL